MEKYDRTSDLIGKMIETIEKTECTYQEVMYAIEILKNYYEENGNNFLNNISIQEIVALGGYQTDFSFVG